MKRFEEIEFVARQCAGELKEFSERLIEGASLQERRDLKPFFERAKQLCAFIGTYVADIGSADLLAYEFEVAGVSSQFQGFCRDLHSEAVDYICGPVTASDVRMLLLRIRLTTGRKLDAGNPNPGNLGADFGFFNLRLWSALYAHDIANEGRNKILESLNEWRNAIAHQDFDAKKLGGRTALRLNDVRQWRRTCEALAVDMDVVVGVHVATITGVNPW